MPGVVALLHGWGGSFAATFVANGWLPELHAAGREVIGLDLPGHGAGRPASHDSADYADLATAIDARLPRGPLDIVGYSLGAKLALELASRAPHRFGRLVAGGVGDNLFAPEPSGEMVAAALENGTGPETPPLVRAVVDYARPSGSDPRALAAVLRRPPNPVASRERLGRIASDILVVNGTADRVARPDSALLASLPHAEHLELDGIGHFDLPAAATFRNAALAFLGIRPVDHPGCASASDG